MSKAYVCTECSVLTTKDDEEWGHPCPGQGEGARCESHLAKIEIVESSELAKLRAVATAAKELPEKLKARCPWPVEVFTLNDDKEYARLIPNPKNRTAASGYLMREGWRLCAEYIEEHLASLEDK